MDSERKDDLVFPGDEDQEDNPVISITDYYDEQDKAINASIAVIGPFGDKQCSYDLIKVPQRQAVFSCATCETSINPETGLKYQAGFCFACSENCHKDHEIYELLTKRNFNCDCGSDRYSKPDCQLFNKTGFNNPTNVYNHNFDGKFCVCDRERFPPEYMDPEMDEQLQCVMCEDWFHISHISPMEVCEGTTIDDEKNEDMEDIFCSMCVKKHPFLVFYFHSPAKECQESKGKKSPIPDQKRRLEQLETEEKSSSSSVSPSASSSCSTSKTPTSGPENVCKLLAAKEKLGKPDEDGEEFGKMLKTFKVFSGWRKLLCRCDDCVKMYEERQIGYLIDQTDSIEDYEDQTAQQRNVDHFEEALSSLSHVQKIGFVTMEQKVARFFDSFRGKIITKDDVKEFTEREFKRPRLN